jgi:two-component system, cell cycle sensor histidine kinase and response regulator CckA
MLSSVRKFFILPVPEEDWDKARVVRMFQSYSLITLVLLLLLGVANIFVFVKKSVPFLSLIVLLLLLLISQVLARRDRIRLAGTVLVYGTWLISTVHIWLSGGINSVSAGLYVAIIPIAGVLLGGRAAIVVAVLSAATSLGMTTLAGAGYPLSNYYPMPEWSAWFVLMFCLILTAPAINSSIQGFDEALLRSRQEIMNRQKAEELLRESQQELYRVIESISDCFFVTNHELIVTYFNKSAELILHRRRHEVVGQKLFEAFPEAKGSIFEEKYTEALKEKTQLGFETYFGIKPYENWYDVRVYPFEDGISVYFQVTTERKEAENKLRASEERYRAVFDNAGIGIDLLDRDGRILQVNQALSDMLGYSEKELSQLTFLDITHPEERGISKRNLDALIRGEIKFYRLEKRYLRKDRSILWADLTTSAICGPNGEHTGTVGVIADITQRKQAEDALRDSEQQYRAFFATSHDPVFMTGLDGQFIDFNDVALEVFGYAPDDRDGLLQTNVANAYANPEEREAHSALVAKQGFCKEYPLDLRKKDGTIIQALITTVVRKDSRGAIIGFQGSVRDITEQKRSEQKLRDSEARLLDLYENAPNAYFSVSTDGLIRKCNKCAEKLLGYPREMLEGKRVFDLYVDGPEGKEKAAKVFQKFISGEHVTNEELQMQKADGSLIWISLSVNTFRDAGGQVVGSRSSVIDISERKIADQEREQLRNQLTHAQKMESIGTLAGGIAHDFNNLLTIINGYSELILSEKTADDPSYSDLQKILATGRKGADLVRRLLAFSKNAEITLRPLEVNPIVENTVMLLKRTFPKMIEIETSLARDLRMVHGDSTQIEQVFVNLGINAKEAMPDGGKLRMETKNVTLDEARCRLHVGAKTGPYVLIEVTDTGAGMDPDTLGRIFDPFFTTKGWDSRKGTGLGLSVAKGIVEQHGGWITCESEPGNGTTFAVYFPMIEDPAAVRKPEPSAQTVAGGERILLVDDEEHIRDLGKRILEGAGYKVITAANGKEALDLYEREQSNVALVVLDLMMPHMGGDKCLEELLKVNPHVKVIISTGHSLSRQGQDQFGVFAKAFINKPYQIKQLLEVVRGVLDAE